jgi:alpha-L-fucosidase
MPAPFSTHCDSIAQWMAHSQESLIGAGPSPGDHHANVAITTRGDQWYLHVPPRHEGSVRLFDVEMPREVAMLKTRKKLPFRYANRAVLIDPSPEQLADIDNVIKIYWK